MWVASDGSTAGTTLNLHTTVQGLSLGSFAFLFHFGNLSCSTKVLYIRDHKGLGFSCQPHNTFIALLGSIGSV